jgi:hypothetical protein
MTRRTARLLLPLAALVLLAGGRARADFVDYSYHWSVQPSSVLPGGTGSVTLAVAADGTGSSDTAATTATVLPGATITTSSSASNPPDSFNTDFTMKLQLTDSASHVTGELTFQGTLSGTLTATSSSLTSTFHNPVTQTLTLGGHVYTVTIDPTLINLPSPTSPSPAAIDALMTVANKAPPVSQTPEPSGLVLGATAVLGLAARRWLRGRGRPA